VEWSSTFEADGLPASEAAELLESALTANCLALSHPPITNFCKNGPKSRLIFV